MTRTTALLLSGASLAAAGGQLLFRVGARGNASWTAFLNAPIAGGLLLYALGTGLWIYALSKETLTVVYPYTVLTFALVYIGSICILGESLSLRAMCGVALVIGGLYLMAVSS